MLMDLGLFVFCR